MPRVVSALEKLNAIKLMTQGKDNGVPLGQREIERETGLSRPYIRKLAREIGYQFARNGVEILGRLCMCAACGRLFRRPNSKVVRAKKQFCDKECKMTFMKGANHPAWKSGKTVVSFSSWAKNQGEYDAWRKAVLERDGNKCVISGRTDNLQVHHIHPKQEKINPEKAFLVENGITVNDDVHREIHKLIREGSGFEEAIEKLKQQYKNATNNQ